MSGNNTNMIINGISILTVIAAKAEYGAMMAKTILEPKFIGVGPIEATFNMTKILMEKQQNNELPDIIFSIGTAGSNSLHQAELYQITSVSYRDMNAVAFGFDKGVTPFAEYPVKFELPILFKDMPTATLATGASVIDTQGTAGISFADIDADCVDMETYGVVRVAHDFKIPVIGLRGISDGLHDSKGVISWEEYLSIIDTKIAAFYDRIHNQTPSLIQIVAEAKESLDDDA